jgi:anti-sigma factor RsiW
MASLAVLALLVIGTAFWLQRLGSNESGLGELADLHISALASAHPVDVVSSDRHTVKPWFQGKLPFTFNLPELQNSPFTLLGGRLAYFQQSPGAQLLFGIRKHEISVFIFQSRARLSDTSLRIVAGKTSTFNCESWTEGGLRYFVVGEAAPADMHALSAILQDAARQ